jgi:hypothetical protein
LLPFATICPELLMPAAELRTTPLPAGMSPFRSLKVASRY